MGLAHVPVIRLGDISNPMTVLCTTTSRTAVGSKGRQLQSGTDYISRTDHLVKFAAGEAISNCDIRVSYTNVSYCQGSLENSN